MACSLSLSRALLCFLGSHDRRRLKRLRGKYMSGINFLFRRTRTGAERASERSFHGLYLHLSSYAVTNTDSPRRPRDGLDRVGCFALLCFGCLEKICTKKELCLCACIIFVFGHYSPRLQKRMGCFCMKNKKVRRGCSFFVNGGRKKNALDYSGANNTQKITLRLLFSLSYSQFAHFLSLCEVFYNVAKVKWGAFPFIHASFHFIPGVLQNERRGTGGKKGKVSVSK